MDKFILLSMKRTGSNHLMNSLAMASHKKFVWFDAPPDIWKTFDLPFSKRKVTFKLLTSGDEKMIDREITALNKINKEVGSELTTRLKYMITSVDGDNKKTSIIDFVDNQFLSRDSFALRHHIKRITPDVDMTATYIDPEDNEEKEMTVPLTVSFLWPAA